MKLDNLHIGKYKVFIYAGAVIAGVALANIAFGQGIPDYNKREIERINKVKVAYADFMSVAQTHYCLNKAGDLESKIEIKKALGEDTTELKEAKAVIVSKEGCEQSIQDLVF
jgi:hypothetical protein